MALLRATCTINILNSVNYCRLNKMFIISHFNKHNTNMLISVLLLISYPKIYSHELIRFIISPQHRSQVEFLAFADGRETICETENMKKQLDNIKQDGHKVRTHWATAKNTMHKVDKSRYLGESTTVRNKTSEEVKKESKEVETTYLAIKVYNKKNINE